MLISEEAGAGARQGKRITFIPSKPSSSRAQPALRMMKALFFLPLHKSIMNKYIFFLLFFSLTQTFAQNNSAITWRAAIHRQDGQNLIFTFRIQQSRLKKIIVISNGAELITIPNTRFTKDSVFIEMPVFESSFKAKISRDSWEGTWTRATSGDTWILPFSATSKSPRFVATEGPAKYNMSGRWAVSFASDHEEKASSLAEFVQKGNHLVGTFLLASGDYRYQEGIVTGDKFMLSGFDGAHAYLFTGTLVNDHTIKDAHFYAGARSTDTWTGVKDPHAKVSTDPVAMFLKPGEERLNFNFPDLHGKMVSINDERYKNKVVIIQLMGSWCPNCMDETAFLSEYYNKNRQRGVEIMGLAYEYSTDFKRSVASLSKFQKRFNVRYPVLITGVTVKDTLRTEKTLPQVTPIKVFPTSIIIDKHGKVRYFETDFFGQGTGEHYVAFKKNFNKTIDDLLKEK